MSTSVRYFERDFDPESVVAEGRARVAVQAAEASGEVPAAPPQRAWARFHWRNAGRFFHERRYLTAAFPALACSDTSALDAMLIRSGAPTRETVAFPSRPLVLLETGAGNGSNVAALRAANPAARLLVTDFCAASLRFCMKSLVDFEPQLHATTEISSNPASPPPEFYLFDVTTCGLPKGATSLTPATATTAATSGGALEVADNDWAALPEDLRGGIDAALCTFVLSAVPPAAHAAAIRGISNTLRPGGLLCFRDYAQYDAAQLRARPANVVSQHLHVRGDGTLAYYFSEAEVRSHLEAAGLAVIELRTCAVAQRNRARGTEMRRLFIHAQAVKM